jgi:hypothetical protein
MKNAPSTNILKNITITKAINSFFPPKDKRVEHRKLNIRDCSLSDTSESGEWNNIPVYEVRIARNCLTAALSQHTNNARKSCTPWCLCPLLSLCYYPPHTTKIFSHCIDELERKATAVLDCSRCTI